MTKHPDSPESPISSGCPPRTYDLFTDIGDANKAVERLKAELEAVKADCEDLRNANAYLSQRADLTLMAYMAYKDWANLEMDRANHAEMSYHDFAKQEKDDE